MSAPATALSGRMSLAQVKHGKIDTPRRILLHGVEKVGKSSFAAQAPGAIFVCPEDGTAQLNVSRFPEPRIWQEVLEAVETLRLEPHDYQYVVFDTLDWIEPMVGDFVCKRDGKKDLESYGYGKGPIAALGEWRLFVKALERLRADRGMHIIFLAHSIVKGFKNPVGEDFDRYELKLHQKAAGLFKEWCDAVLFATHEQYAYKDGQTQRVRGVSTGQRIIHTEPNAAYDAGNRYSLPAQMPLDWQTFSDAVVAGSDPVQLTATIEQLLVGADAEFAAQVRATVATNPTDAAFLGRVLTKLRARLSASPKETKE